MKWKRGRVILERNMDEMYMKAMMPYLLTYMKSRHKRLNFTSNPEKEGRKSKEVQI